MAEGLDIDEEPGGGIYIWGRVTQENIGRLVLGGSDDDPDLGGEFAKLIRPLNPPNIGGVALRQPDGKNILELV
ncbi:MAG TPA: hypothetical protein VK534_00440 [Methylomirabilota bacterium]|nr:hypothetical protein [Methylomirabilota bacterium]